MRIIAAPDHHAIARWGILAHVPQSERVRILSLPSSAHYMREIKQIEQEVAARSPKRVRR